MIIRWLGPCSKESTALKAFVDSFQHNAPEHSPIAIGKKGSRGTLIVSEDAQLLNQFEQDDRNTLQIQITSELDFQRFVLNHLRPTTRYFHIFDKQNESDFKQLIQFLKQKTQQTSLRSGVRSHHLAMQNTMEVLSKMTSQQLHEIEGFIKSDENRRYDFQSLIRLARNLTMSLDIEDVVESFWKQFKTQDQILRFNVLIGTVERPQFLVEQISGKFHFKKLDSQQFLMTSNLLKEWSEGDRASNNPKWFPIPGKLVSTLGGDFQNAWIYALPSSKEEGKTWLLFGGKPDWSPTPRFIDFLNERAIFFQLSMEKSLLDEDVKANTQLWINTFDYFSDPLAIVTSSHSLLRSNKAFDSLPWQTQGLMDTLKKNLSAPTSQDPLEVSFNGKIYLVRIFPFFSKNLEARDVSILHLTDVTHERNLYSQFLQSEKMTAVGRLAGDLSQALNAPLRQIESACELIMKDPKCPSPLEKDAVEILKASQRSLRIISDFHSFSEGRIERHEFFAEELIEKTIPLVKALLHGLRFQLILSEQRHLISGSSSLLQQVLYNLLRNAHQAMDGKGELQIQTQSLHFEGRSGVKISVLDSGAGVSDEFASKIFQPLATTKSPQEGNGLGLHIVKKIVYEHLGQVGYMNRPSGGAEFWFWLPLSNSEVHQ